MDAAKLIGVRQRFISRIDDGSILLHPFEKIVHDMVGALRDLKRKRASISLERGPMYNQRTALNPAIHRTGGADASGAGKDLPRDQEGDQLIEAAARKWKLASDEIVFMRPEGGICLVINIVFNERNRIGKSEILQGGL